MHRFLMRGSQTCFERRSIATKRSRTHSPSFESVLALAPNEAAAKNSATTPMAAPAMSAASAAPLPSYVLLLLLLPLHSWTIPLRSKKQDQLLYAEKKVSFFVPLFLYACGAELWCQRARMKEVGKAVLNISVTASAVLLFACWSGVNARFWRLMTTLGLLEQCN